MGKMHIVLFLKCAISEKMKICYAFVWKLPLNAKSIILSEFRIVNNKSIFTMPCTLLYQPPNRNIESSLNQFTGSLSLRTVALFEFLLTIGFGMRQNMEQI